MASPYSTGGGGTHFEARVAATYLAAILCEAPARGLPGELAKEIQTQAAASGEPLDDLVIRGILVDGRETKLSLQVKSDLKFTSKDSEWISVVDAAWDTFVSPGFDPSRHRIGVAIANYNDNIDKYYQSILTWAAHSTSGTEFVARINRKDFSHRKKVAFVAALRSILGAHIGRAPTDEEVWGFLRCFVILHFDLNLEDRSRDAAAAIDRLRDLLRNSTHQQAPAVWAFLIQQAGSLIPSAGVADRGSLVDGLNDASLPAGSPTSYRPSIETLNHESALALAQIRTDIAGLNLFRAEAYEKLKKALARARFVQIDGEPGVGKSALLKSLAEECARSGPIFVLKDRRIHPRGWSAHAHVLNVCADPAILLREFGCAGEPILFIDGVDKIDDPAQQATVNDLVRTIAQSEFLGRWRIVVTVRAQNLRHIETWLDVASLQTLGLATVTVGNLGKAERDAVASAHPSLAALFHQTDALDVILSRPFFIDALLNLVRRSGTDDLPATEVDLLKLWWSLGGSDSQDLFAAQHRRNALMQFAAQMILAPTKPLNIGMLPPEPIEELKAAGVLSDKDFGHSVIFAHDIYEEWTLCEFLHSQQDKIAQVLIDSKEPQDLVRPLQLLGTYLLETEASTLEWEALFSKSARDDLRPVWQRAVLSAPLHSTRARDLLEKLSDFLLANDAACFKRLLLALKTIEVVPNPLYLNDHLMPGLEPDDRVKCAEYAAVPNFTPWLRTLVWLVPRLRSLPPNLIPDLIPVLLTWQESYAGYEIWLCREIGNVAYVWLEEFERARYVDSFSDLRKPFGLDLDYHAEEELENSIRKLFLMSAGDVPTLVRPYLENLTRDKRRCRNLRNEIAKGPIQLIANCPKDVVDFILAAFLANPEGEDDEDEPFGRSYRHFWNEFGVGDFQSFRPDSPLQMPFLALLRNHEEEGLRLIKGICNHSIRTWRWLKANAPDPYHFPLTPIAIEVELPWGIQRFWGDYQVYLWYRGYWGNNASKSALMALELWALQRLEAGAEFAEIFRKCVEGQECVGALGLAVSLCLADPSKAIDWALPLVTCPYLWHWDLLRVLEDQKKPPSNELGDWYRDRPFLQGTRDLNQKPHRRHEIRNLIPYFVYHPDEAVRNRYATAIRRFTQMLPFDYEEQRSNEEYATQLAERMKIYEEQGDPKYWHQRPSADGKHIEFYNDAPSLREPKIQAQKEESLLLNKASALALWGQKTLEQGVPDDQFSLESAWSLAKELDAPDLFDEFIVPEDILRTQRRAAIAAVAYVLARHDETESWANERSGWCLDTLQRAATIPESDDDFAYRGSVLLMHPSVFAAYGYSALLARGWEVQAAQSALFNLAVDALNEIVRSVYAASKLYASAYPHFFRVLVCLGLRQCIVARDDLPDYHAIQWDEREATDKLNLIEWAEGALESGAEPEFPLVPMSWVKADKPLKRGRGTTDYARNEILFRFDLAQNILFEAHLPSLLDGSVRPDFLKLVSNLLEWTIEEIVPPGSDRRSGARESNPPFEWIYAFSAWCGKVCAQLTADEARACVIDRVLAFDNDKAFMMLQSVMRLFMVFAFVRVNSINMEQRRLWADLIDWLLEHRDWKWAKKRGHLSREFQDCVLSALFCFHDNFGPVRCVVTEGWPHLPLFVPLLERSIREFGQDETLFHVALTFLEQGGFDLLPDPALGWLTELVSLKKDDQAFWAANGSETVSLLRQLMERRSDALSPDNRAALISITDILTDNGVRGAGFLQQELARAAN